MTRLRITLAALATSGLLLGACSSSSTANESTSSTSTTSASPGEGKFTRVILAQSEPANAPGQTLYLQKVIFGPHAVIPLHHHEGFQESTVTTGNLNYTVVEGSAGLRLASGATSTINAGSTVVLHPGDTLLEYETTIHKAANTTNKVVELIISSLLTTGAPLSTLN